MYKKILFPVFILFAAVAGFTSCGHAPNACFASSINEDSIHVNQAVTFNAACTSNGDGFNWQFYGNEDSVEFGSIVTKAFPDTGSVNVYLLVTNGKKSSSVTRDIRVIP